MNAYRIFNATRRYKTIDYKDSPIVNNIGECVWKDIGEISAFNYHWDEECDSDDICDAPFVAGFIPVFSERIYLQLCKMINTDECQVIPIVVSGSRYYVVNTMSMAEGLINMKQSEVKYFSSGKVMDVKNYVFNNTDIPAFFKISEYPVFTFVNEAVAEFLSNEAVGLEVEKCSTKKRFGLF